jgi:hypothetical protein
VLAKSLAPGDARPGQLEPRALQQRLWVARVGGVHQELKVARRRARPTVNGVVLGGALAVSRVHAERAGGARVVGEKAVGYVVGGGIQGVAGGPAGEADAGAKLGVLLREESGWDALRGRVGLELQVLFDWVWGRLI